MLRRPPARAQRKGCRAVLAVALALVAIVIAVFAELEHRAALRAELRGGRR